MHMKIFLRGLVVFTFAIVVAVAIARAADGTTNELAALKAEVERLKGLVPDQSHAMKDVGYHFANLWFAAEKKNWPLADFYASETGRTCAGRSASSRCAKTRRDTRFGSRKFWNRLRKPL
jgi:hypothetical protein